MKFLNEQYNENYDSVFNEEFHEISMNEGTPLQIQEVIGQLKLIQMIIIGIYLPRIYCIFKFI
jgi:hypothetical protein